jgi:hypothetical protein
MRVSPWGSLAFMLPDASRTNATLRPVSAVAASKDAMKAVMTVLPAMSAAPARSPIAVMTPVLSIEFPFVLLAGRGAKVPLQI